MPMIQVGVNVTVNYATKQRTEEPILRDLDECRAERAAEVLGKLQAHVDTVIRPQEREQLAALYVRTLGRKAKGQAVDPKAEANLDARLQWAEDAMLLAEEIENQIAQLTDWHTLSQVDFTDAHKQQLGLPPARIRPGRLVGALRGNRPLP